MEIKKYLRKPFVVDAVQVTEENIEKVAEWCGGQVKERPDRKTHVKLRYVKVPVYRSMSRRQTEAYIGDWVLQAGKGFKVYIDKAFANTFEEPDTSEGELVAVQSQGGEE